MTTPSSQPTRIRWLVFALACATSFLLYLHRYTWGIVKTQVGDEFGWSADQLGWLDGVFFTSYSVSQVPTGMLCDWFGAHLLLGSSIAAWSLMMGAAALAGGFWSMLATRLLFGVAQAGCYPALNKVSRVWFPLSMRSAAQGWIATFFGRGGGAASFFLVGTVLLGWFQLPWRGVLAGLTVLGLAFGIVFYLLFRNTPAEHFWANPAEAELIGEGRAVQATGAAMNWGFALRQRNVWACFLEQFTSAYADNVFVFWVPLFLLTAKQVDLAQAGWMAALPLISGALGGTFAGTLQNTLVGRLRHRRWARSPIGLTGKLIAAVLMLLSLKLESAMATVWALSVIKFFSDWSQPTMWATTTDVAPRNSASLFAAINTVGSFAAFVAGPTMGWIIMAFSHDVNASNVQATVQLEEQRWVAQLPHRSLFPESVTGTILDGSDADRLLARFSVSKEGAVSISASEGFATPKAELDATRGILTLFRDDTPPQDWHVVASYRYTSYGSGWAALFTEVAVMYFISSMAWLVIDCTKPVEPE